MRIFPALSWLQKNLALTIPATMLLGLVTGLLVDTSALKSAILPLTILMIYPMMVAMNFKAIVSECRPRAQGMTQLLNLIILPLVAFGLGQLFLRDQPLLAFGLLLIGLLPTSGMTISWTGFAGGNVKLAVKMTVLGLVLGALITPFYGSLLMGRDVSLPIGRTLQQVGLVVFVPMILGIVTRTLLVKRVGQKEFDATIKPRFPALSTLGVLGMIFTALSLRAEVIVAEPLAVLALLPPLLLFYLVSFSLGTLGGRTWLPGKDAVALVYGSSMRNLSIALAIALTVFSKEQGAQMALIIALAFIVQVQAAAWYMKFAGRFFPSLGQSG